MHLRSFNFHSIHAGLRVNLNTPIYYLARSVFSIYIYNGKSCYLQGDQEQRGLKLSQITKSVKSVGGEDVNCYIYREFGSKLTRWLSSLNSDNKY